jgi:hypothetical protein
MNFMISSLHYSAGLLSEYFEEIVTLGVGKREQEASRRNFAYMNLPMLGQIEKKSRIEV